VIPPESYCPGAVWGGIVGGWVAQTIGEAYHRRGGSTTEAVLNLVWALLCIGTLTCHFWRDRRRSGMGNRALRWQRGISVFLAAVALFPVISASDDRLRLADICTTPAPQSPVLDCGQIHGSAPSPPLEDPEHGQTTAPFLLFTSLVSLFEVAPAEATRLLGSITSRPLGRAPPPSSAQA
jgi:hypothetical protein